MWKLVPPTFIRPEAKPILIFVRPEANSNLSQLVRPSLDLAPSLDFGIFFGQGNSYCRSVVKVLVLGSGPCVLFF